MLREAILARNAPGAGIALERLLRLDPSHERARDAGTLIAVLEVPGPRRAFDVVRDLPTNRANDAHRIALRRELKTLHPALLSGYLNRFVGN